MHDNDENPTIKELIRLAKEQKIFLPEFQREYVWERIQIKLLIDSLYKGYTISSILTWEGNDVLARRRIGGSINEITFPDYNSENKILYLLDGQQRITSLTAVFTNVPIYKRKNSRKKEDVRIFFDSLSESEDPESTFVYGDEPIFIDGEEIFLEDYEPEEILRKFKGRFIFTKDVMKATDSKFIQSLQEILQGDFPNYLTKLIELKEKILDRRVVNITQKGDLSDVLSIFERINTQNTKLNISDIMIAKTYKKFDEDKYFDLRTYLRILNHNGPIKSDFFENRDSENIDLDNELYLDEPTTLFLIMEILKKKFKQKEVLSLTTEDLMQNMKSVHNTYWSVLNFMKQNFSIELNEIKNFRPLVKFLVIFFAENNKPDVENLQFLRKWFWNTLIYNRYPGAQNEKVERDYKVLNEQGKEKAMRQYLNERTKSFNKPVIDAQYGGRDKTYDSLKQMILSNGCKDFYAGVLVTKGNQLNAKLEDHHIFPKKSSIIKELKPDTEEDLINNIANIAFISKETNNSKINNKNPSEYITDFEKEYEQLGKVDEFYDIMESQFISREMVDLLKKDGFHAFISKRTERIKEKISQLCD